MDFLEYKGYKGSVEYSKEDNCLFGKVQGLSKDLITYEGQTLDELRQDFEAGIDSYLEGCKADGVEPAKPYSGKLNLRMSSELHSRVAAIAASTGTTINDFINRAIKNELKKVAAL
jgi:predicted HicB family RNase H-like nuclease